MIKKITSSEKSGNSHIAILFPGKSLGKNDTGIGSIGRIDQANIEGGTTIKMHPHANDEILSYFRTGKVIHTDSAKNTETITRQRLMLMKAGKVFYHEEKIIEKLEGLQIFIRPQTRDYTPDVAFYELGMEDSWNNWRLLASNKQTAPLRFTSETEIYDIQLNNNENHQVPATLLETPLSILYVFQGSVLVNNEIPLVKGECVLFENEEVLFATNEVAELVLFVTNQHQECFKAGMFSGNQM